MLKDEVIVRFVSKWAPLQWLRRNSIPKFMLLGYAGDLTKEASKHVVKKITAALAGAVCAAAIIVLTGGSTESLLFLLIPFALTFAVENDIDRKIKNRRREIALDFPVLLNKLSLLVGAGLTVRGSVKRILEARKSNGNNLTCLYKEMEIMIGNMEAGVEESRALESFARRCGTPEANMLVSLVIQNIRTGGIKMSYLFRILSASAWQNRVTTARKAGEEASEKLFLPLSIVFIAIMILLSAPALMHMSF